MKDILRENGFTYQSKFDEKFSDIVNYISFKGEEVYHGSPSGLDNYNVCYGGLCIYDSAKKSFSNLPSSFINNILLLVIDTGVKKNTKMAVMEIKGKLQSIETKQMAYEAIFKIGKITKDVIACLDDSNTKSENEKFETICSNLSENQKLLASLSVSHPKIEEVIEVCDSLNIICKLTGGGLGGSCLAIGLQKNRQEMLQLQKILLMKGFESVMVECDKTGIQEEFYSKL